jgi:tRNA(fMet)-specific endonuclease VapC
MEMKWLLDTNVWIEILKGRNMVLIPRFIRKPKTDVFGCAAVRAELMHGACKYDFPDERRAKVTGLLDKHASLPFDDRCADAYALIRHDLEARRCIIGPYDLQIAAIALVNDLTLVTGNGDEFKRVQGLKVEDWSVPLA